MLSHYLLAIQPNLQLGDLVVSSHLDRAKTGRLSHLKILFGKIHESGWEHGRVIPHFLPGPLQHTRRPKYAFDGT